MDIDVNKVLEKYAARCQELEFNNIVLQAQIEQLQEQLEQREEKGNTDNDT